MDNALGTASSLWQKQLKKYLKLNKVFENLPSKHCEPYVYQYKEYNTNTESLTFREEGTEAEKQMSVRENI